MKKIEEIKYLTNWLTRDKGEETNENLIESSESSTDSKQNTKNNPIKLFPAIVEIGASALKESLPSLSIPFSNIGSSDDTPAVCNASKALETTRLNKTPDIPEEWLDEETKSFINIITPLFNVIKASKASFNINDYVDTIKITKEATPLDFTSEEVCSLLKEQYEKKSALELIYRYVPSRKEHEELGMAFNRDKNQFIEKLPLYMKDQSLYTFCYNYRLLEEEYYSLDMNQKFDTWIYLRIKSGRMKQQQSMETLMSDTKRMLLYIQNIPLTEEQRNIYNDAINTQCIAELYNEAMGVDPDAVEVDEIFRSDLDKATHNALVELIAKYFENNQHKARGKDYMEVDAIAQKSVVLLLKDEGLLNPSTLDKTTHAIATQLIQRVMNSEHNIRSSNSYNKTEEYQEERKKRHAVREKINAKIKEFNDFERALKKIIEKNE